MNNQNDYENLVEHRAESGVNDASIFRLIINKLLFVKHSPHLKLILLRLPSLILADVLIQNSSSLYDYFIPAESLASMSLMNHLIVFTILRSSMIFALFTCFLLFTLSLTYVVNIYKVMALFSLPFLFTYLMDLCYSYDHTSSFDSFVVWNSVKPWLSEQIVILVLVCLSYSFIVSMTILLYNDIYKTIIFDKYNLRQLNLLNVDAAASANNVNMQRLADYQYDQMFASHNQQGGTTNTDNTRGQDNTSRLRIYTYEEMYSEHSFKWFFMNFRRVYILAYSVFSLVVNEFYIIFNNSDDSEDKQPFNIMSLGYLALLTFDLTVNLDQMLVRLFVKIRVLNRLVSTYGINNFITWNWYERLRVPFVLRVYLFVRVYLFTMNFLFYTDFYRGFYSRLSSHSHQDQNSLFAFIRSFYNLFGSSEPNTEQSSMSGADDYHATSIMGHVFSLFPFVKTPYSKIEPAEYDLDVNIYSLYFKMVVLNVSSNLVPISAITSFLSWQFYLLGELVRRWLNSKSETNANNVNNQRVNGAAAPPRGNNNNNNDMGGPENDLRNVGDVAALLFILLSIQSGLTTLHPKPRIQKFSRNYSLLFIAMLHYFHTSLDQQLRILSASSKTRVDWYRDEKRLRAIGLSLVLILLPICIMTYSLNECEISTWLLASTAFNLELIVKVTVSLVLYCMFTIESNRINHMQEQLLSEHKKTDSVNESDNIDEDSSFSKNFDDCVYYVKVFGHVFEFIVAIFLFFNGAYILLFESCGLIRALLMGIHVYFHICLKAKKGWKSFTRRRTAISKLKQLDEFNKENYLKLLQSKRPAATTTAYSSDENNNKAKSDEAERIQDEADYETKRRDVCAICFSELSSQEARITRCGHVYHFTCLRKWLYLQDTCPMCHQQIYEPK